MASVMHCLNSLATALVGPLQVLGFAAVKVPLTVTGFVAVAGLIFYLAFASLHGLLKYILPRFLPIGLNLRKIEGWVVVTGVTDGTGKQFALQLAAMGKNIVLVARNPQKLDTVAREIRKQSPQVKTEIIVADFKDAGNLALFERIRRELGSLDVGILINNVGVFVDSFVPFLEYKKELDLEQFNVNVNSAIFMTRTVLPQMVKRGTERPSVIINVSSTAGVLEPPMKYLDIYAATKAFVRYFSVALSHEYKPRGITVTCVTPGLVRTKMVDSFSSTVSGFVAWVAGGIGPEAFVRATLDTIGIGRETSGYWMHALQAYIARLFPEGVPSSLVGRLSQMSTSRRLAAKEQVETKRK